MQDHIFGGEPRSNNLDDDSNDEEEGDHQPASVMQEILAAGRESATSSAFLGRAASRSRVSAKSARSNPRGLSSPQGGGGLTSSQGERSSSTPTQVFDPSSKPSFLGDNFVGS